jgi:hypothetical protein
MFKRLLLLGLISGVLAAVAALIYQKVYFTTNEIDFSGFLKPVNVFLICIVACLLASTGYGILTKWLPRYGEIIFNLALMIVSFASILGPIAYKFPLEFESPEFFPGLAIPMHFFPALGWFTLRPLFIKK